MTSTPQQSFSDVAAKLRKKEQDKPKPPPRDFEELYTVRSRILGILIRDAQLIKGLSDAQVAEEIGIPLETFQAWELGEQSPTLPQLELLAFFLGIPVSHFWDTKTIRAQTPTDTIPQDTFLELRDRVIGAQLQQARQAANLTIEQVAEASGLPVETVNGYESGEQPIPFPHLTSLASAVRVQLTSFVDDSSRVGDSLNKLEAAQHFYDLPEELRNFVAVPANLPYLELALKLSKLPLEELRQVGVSILNITY